MSDDSGHIIKDQWLTQIIGKNTFQLHVNEKFFDCVKEKGSFENTFIQGISKQSCFAFAKVDTSEIRSSNFLENLGFHLVDTNVTLICDQLNNFAESHGDEITVEFAIDSDKDEVIGVAQSSFIYSRFHLDEQFPKQLSDTIKGEWVKNFFLGARGDSMIVAKVKDEVVGFLQIIETTDSFIIDLIAVSQRFRGKGIGKAMINFAKQKYFSTKKNSIVGTQISNIPSINLYQGLGYKVISSKYIFHYHS